MRVAIIGTGFLGEAICDALKKQGIDVVMTHHSHQKYQESIRYDFFQDDPAEIFAEEKIDAVIIPAKIEFTEDSVALGQAMERLPRFFKDSRIVYISSDGIFDGTRGMHSESDLPHPVTLYGRNLELCEGLVRSQAKNHCIVRPSYMYGFVGGMLDERLEAARKELNQGKEISRFTDMYKSPLSYHQAAEAIVSLASAEYVGTVHISGERMSVYEFTKQGMEALDVPTVRLHGVPIPSPCPDGMLPDTSLDNTLMQKLTKIKPLSIRESLHHTLK